MPSSHSLDSLVVDFDDDHAVANAGLLLPATLADRLGIEATRADTGEVLHARQRTGRAASGRGAERFVNETAGRVRRAGATGPLTLRADSGFWSAKVLAACRRHGIRFSITVRQVSTVCAAITSIPEHAWVEIDYPTADAPRSPRPPWARIGWWCAAPA
jgi:Transposase DDE domain group 1